MIENVYIKIAVMILTLYAIRAVPLLFMRREIKNRIIKSFLFYVPYVTLAVMTFPAIITATGNNWCGLAALIAGLIAAWFGQSLIVVACICCLAALAGGFIF